MGKTASDVSTVARALRALSIENEFPRIHYFASPRFATKPFRLERFERYREKVGEFRPGENVQTVLRALAVAERVRAGRSTARALREAWQS